MEMLPAFLLVSIAVTIHSSEYGIWCLEACRYYRTQPDWTQRMNPEKIARIDCYPIGHARNVLHIENFCNWFYASRRNNPAQWQLLQQHYTWQQWCSQKGCG